MIMSTVYKWLQENVKNGWIEQILLPNNYILYKVWIKSSILYDNLKIKYGRHCSAKYIATPDNLGLVFNYKLPITKKDKQDEYFTEDEEFYFKHNGA